ncbi:MAG TPA: hypothetical protein VLH79_06350 [Chthonomonadales bacterium]|nr:hypothetical protein [Chthonomonadales bacterium]
MRTTKRQRVISALLAAAAIGCGGVAASETTVPGPAISGPRPNAFGVLEQRLPYLDAKGTPTQRAVSRTEVLRGNGTRAGYVLTHGGLVPDTLRVSVGARTLRRNVDYYVDPVNGSLFFAEPVRRMDSIRVSYSYVPSADGARSAVAAPGLAFQVGGTALNLSYGISAAGPGGLDFTTYGLSMNSRLGSGGSLSGLMYFSSPADSNANRIVDPVTRVAQARPNASQARGGHLIVQNLNVKSGAASFRANYQDVGATFNGFQAMRGAHAGNAESLGLIGALERERGIRRLGLGMALQTGKASSFGFDWDTINDATGQIVRQGINYKAGGLNLQYNTQRVDSGFQAFRSLREAEVGQWARERGVSRTNLALGLAMGKGGALGFGQSSIGDRTGSVSSQTLDFTSARFNVAMSERRADRGFARLNDLSDADKTALALDIRRQFNPKATAAEVTAKDRQQIALEAGLERRRLSLDGTFGKAGGYQFNQFGIQDGRGAIQRQALNLSGANFAASFLDQRISDSFGRLGSLSDFERSQFANERGMRRTAMGLNLRLNKASSLNFSQLTASDATAGMSRQSFAYAGHKLEARVDLAEIDEAFTRARDMAGLSDAERASIEGERGFRRMAVTGKVTSLRNVTLDTYSYDARNMRTDEARNAFRHNLVWQLNRGGGLNFLTEGNANRHDGRVRDGRTRTMLGAQQQFANGMRVSAFHDVVSSVAAGADQPKVVTNFLGLQTDRSKPNNLLAETRRSQIGSDRFENTTQLDLNYRASRSLGLRFNKLSVDRGDEPSTDTNALFWNWQVHRGLNFSGSYAMTGTNNGQDATTQSYTLSGMATPNLNVAGTFSETKQAGAHVRSTREIAISNAKPGNALGLRQVTLTTRYTSVQERGRLTSEMVAGRVQGMLGRNQIAFEYGGMLDPRNNSAQARTFSFTTDPNPKLPFHASLMYSARNTNRGALQLIRQYNLSYRMDRRTNLTYAFSSLPTGPNGQLKPVTTSAFSLRRDLGGSANLSVDYTTMTNMAQRVMTNRFGALLTGKVDRLASVQVGYSVDINTVNGADTNSHTLRLGYDRQVDNDNFVSINSAFTMHQNGQPNELRTNLDYRVRF